MLTCHFFQKKTLIALWKDRLAWLVEHLNVRPPTIYVPRYRNSVTHGIIWPLDVLMLLHLTSHRGPMRIQQDFFSFMFMSNQLSSTARASNNSCNSLTEGAINKMSPTYSTTYTDISTYFYMSYSIGSTVSLHDDERDLLVIAKFLDLVL